MLPLFLSLLALALPVIVAVLTARLFRTRAVRPDLVESAVAIAAGLGAAAFAGLIGFVVAVIACATFLTGEASEAGLILGPCAALVLASLAFVLTVRLLLRRGDPSVARGETLG